MANFELNNYKFEPRIELNNIKTNKQITEKSPIVEIFSAMIKGQDTTKYGEKANRAYTQIKKLASDAEAGDGRARVELNTITSVMVEAPLLQRLQLLSFMGNLTQVGYDERLLYKVFKLQGKSSNFQANGGDVAFNMSTFDYRELQTQTISGGISSNYRQIATGNLDGHGVQMEQTITDMYNKIFYKIMNDLYTGIKGATGIKRFSEAAGITKASVDSMQKQIRRYGKVGVFGDYSVVSQINDMVGFTTTTGGLATSQFPQSVIEQIMATGLLQAYKSMPVVEIPNTYNLTSLNAAGTD